MKELIGKELIGKEFLSTVFEHPTCTGGYMKENDTLSVYWGMIGCRAIDDCEEYEECINIHELANMCKDKVREYGYIIKSGFNDAILEDDGNIALDWNEVDKYRVEVKKVIYNYKNTFQDKIVTIAFFEGEDLQKLDIKACQWAYEKEIKCFI